VASAVTEAELEELEGTPAELAFTMEQERGRAIVVPAEGARRALRAVPRLVAEVRRLRGRIHDLEAAEARRAREPRRARQNETQPARESATRSQPAEDLASLLAAPFRVSPRTAAAAKDDPLAALAVQVARSLSEDAGDVERARLIAMAFAAAQGNMEAFWQARKQRSLAKLGALAR
jgi:nucleotide-binding universal stress UspA family protein